jgi:8-oxo-dGTP pyrophosphatase MutT (NUDIX family)
MPRTPQLQEAAVLVPVFRRDARLTMLVVRRTNFGVHGGQLAFPGGKPQDGDESMLQTALRETREEVGVPESSIEVLAELPVIETVTTGYRIHPFLGRIPPADTWEFDPREIAEVIEVAAEDLALPEAHGESVETFPQYPDPLHISYYKVGSYKLWGATYRIVTPLLPRLLAGEWDV